MKPFFFIFCEVMKPDHKGISKPLGKVLLGELFLKYNERKEDGLK